MDDSNLRLHSREYHKIVRTLSVLKEGCRAKGAFLISRSGQEVASNGDVEGLDRQAFSSLAASTMAATFGLAELIGEAEFQRIFHRGGESSLLMCPVGDKALLILVFKGRDRVGVSSRTLSSGILVLRDLLRDRARRGGRHGT
jgi:predicted regulator of Ras-like GTPase activity (Roadblock/LC7/MglB family)